MLQPYLALSDNTVELQHNCSSPVNFTQLWCLATAGTDEGFRAKHLQCSTTTQLHKRMWHEQTCVVGGCTVCLQDLVRQICVTIADHGAADFAVGSLIVELVSSEGHWEAIMIGLKALLSILLQAPARAAGRHLQLPQVRSCQPLRCCALLANSCRQHEHTA